MRTAEDLMSTDLITAHEDTDLAVAWDLMSDHDIRHLPVVDDVGALVGVLSHRDLARSALGAVDGLPMQEQRALLASQRVGQLMQITPETASPDDSLVEIAERMLESKFGCMPVVEGEELVGILTEADFVRLVVLRSERN